MLSFYLSLIETQEDRTLFARIYEEYRQNMFKYARHLLGDDGDAEDMVHEVFLSIVRSGVGRLREIDGTGNLWVYLATAVRNRCYTFLKKQSDVQVMDPTITENVAGLQAGGEAAETSGYAYLVETIRGLPPVYADVLYYALVREERTDTIAKLLGLKAATVRKRISRGKEMLREKLGKDCIA